MAERKYPHLALALTEGENIVSEHTSDLVMNVEVLAGVHDRFDAEHSDPTGTSVGDDGENRDGFTHIEP
jgi:hypothetical protein